MKTYTLTQSQIDEVLKEQRRSCVEAYVKSDLETTCEAIMNAPSPDLSSYEVEREDDGASSSATMNAGCVTHFKVQNNIEQGLKNLIEEIEADIAGLGVNLQESGLSEKEKGYYSGCSIVCKDLRGKLKLLLNIEQKAQECDASKVQ